MPEGTSFWLLHPVFFGDDTLQFGSYDVTAHHPTVSGPHEHGRIHLLQDTREREFDENGTPPWTAPLEDLEIKQAAAAAVVTGCDPALGGRINGANQLSVAVRLLWIGGQREVPRGDGQTFFTVRQSFRMRIHLDLRETPWHFDLTWRA